ncbi:Cation/H+ exchanger - like 5 [Theobroma cacao]|nr:Cation/H+ exchanger - like 5 [Theobroma cacao]
MDSVDTVANKSEDTIVCYAPTMITTNGVWQGDNPLDYSLPLFILQLTLVVVSTRILVFILKPLRQPRVIAEILGGILLGPSVLGRSQGFANTLFPLRSVMVLETMANVGLLYFLFLVGVEMDLSVIRRTGKKALAIAVSGLIEMLVLNVGKDRKVLDDESFAIMVVVAVVMTGIISPIVSTIYRPSRRFVPYKRRTIQTSKLDGELRVLVCIHNPRNVPTMINLLEASHPTKKSPICIYALHLVELTGRASAMLIVHNTRKSGRPALNRTQAQSDHIINAFENFEQHAGCVSVQPLTAISPYSSMHEDICSLAEDKRVALVIIPFHKQQTVDGGMEATNPAFRMVNQNLLANAPCSVGILVDRGLSGSSRLAANEMSHHVAVLFLGGPDDREALVYAWRMCEHPGTRLTVLRFVPGEDAVESTMQPTSDQNDPRILTVETDNSKEKQLDDECINDFRIKIANDESVTYTEKVVNNGEETVAAIRTLDSSHDLFIVGRGQGMMSPLTTGLTDWSECPELGAIGDILASSDFASTVSVLVIQQYVGVLPLESIGTPDSPLQADDDPMNRPAPPRGLAVFY